ncbi:hypothetical protein BU23DRAFT_203377 [Bimuria novae-zelandiae CBS 107.79]|uniref:Uncharacterized protein n=1 Tax=Bimuria novae-zelandiae CBS 107.79 TaxID=1447943 RepID=A0A6A5VC60_9PLEO|nr:hypothetical protein BU23DRAFT_203377 [Bimuria novae-zelandiae CBS 107.79]
MENAPLMLAWAMTLRQTRSSYQVNAGLPPQLYKNARAVYHSSAVHIGYQNITVQHRKWDVVISAVVGWWAKG